MNLKSENPTLYPLKHIQNISTLFNSKFLYFRRFIGVGLEELGVEEFVKGKFFDGGTVVFVSMFMQWCVLYTRPAYFVMSFSFKTKYILIKNIIKLLHLSISERRNCNHSKKKKKYML